MSIPWTFLPAVRKRSNLSSVLFREYLAQRFMNLTSIIASLPERIHLQ